MAKLSERKKAVKELDRVFSLFIRARDNYTCIVCGTDRKVMQNGHYFTRIHYSTRWDELNCNCQCSGCNKRHNMDKEPYRAALISKIGQESFDLLYVKHLKPFKISTPELKILIRHYKKRLKDYEN